MLSFKTEKLIIIINNKEYNNFFFQQFWFVMILDHVKIMSQNIFLVMRVLS